MIQFYTNRYRFMMVSVAIFLIGIIFLFINGAHLDIQFKGGAILKYNYSGALDSEEAAKVAQDALDGRLVSAQIVEDMITRETRLVLNLAGTSGLTAEKHTDLEEALIAQYPDANISLSDSNIVEPYFGHRFMQNSITALIISCSLMIIYIWYAFRKIGGLSAGVMGVLALVHDLFVVFFTFVIFKLPIGANAVAVALTIIGYSLNDTIVIYDRIRENTSKLGASRSMPEIVNLSINQTLMRSVITGGTLAITVGVIYVFALGNGIDSIISFALPMTTGTISGAFTSVCLTGSWWTMWEERKTKRKLATKEAARAARLQSTQTAKATAAQTAAAQAASKQAAKESAPAKPTSSNVKPSAGKGHARKGAGKKSR